MFDFSYGFNDHFHLFLLVFDDVLVVGSAISVDNLHIAALELVVVSFRLAHFYLGAGSNGIVKLCHSLAINLDATALKRGFDL